MKFLMLSLCSCLLFTSQMAFAIGESETEHSISQVEQNWEKCLAEPGGESTVGMNACAATAYEAADVVLNSLYQQIMKELNADLASTDEYAKDYSKETKSRLLAAQRAWIKYRDANCNLVGTQMLGGTGEGPIVGGCIAQTTIDRVKELSAIIYGTDM